MKKLNEHYKKLLNENPWDPSPGVDIPDGGIYKPNYMTPIYQDIIVPNEPSEPGVIPLPPDMPPNPVRPTSTHPEEHNPNWEYWDWDNHIWPHLPDGTPYPQETPIGWPIDLPWPPPPGHPLYHIIKDFYDRYGYIWSGEGDDRGSPPGNNIPGYYHMHHLPRSVLDKIAEQMGIQLLELDPRYQSWFTLDQLKSALLSILGLGSVPAAIISVLGDYGLGNIGNEIHDLHDYIQENEPNQPPQLPEIFPWGFGPPPEGWMFGNEPGENPDLVPPHWFPVKAPAPTWAWDFQNNHLARPYVQKWDPFTQTWYIYNPITYQAYYYNHHTQQWESVPWDTDLFGLPIIPGSWPGM